MKRLSGAEDGGKAAGRGGPCLEDRAELKIAEGAAGRRGRGLEGPRALKMAELAAGSRELLDTSHVQEKILQLFFPH